MLGISNVQDNNIEPSNSQNLDQVKVILVGTSHPGNIGSVARAMKTMGLSQLILVEPQTEIDDKSVALAAGASDVLKRAVVKATLAEAIADCGLVIGASARSRTLPWPMLDPRQTGLKMIGEMPNYPVAVVFGRENSGLSNDELQQCQYHVCIPANPQYSSLNLAMAVQTICYEIRMAWLAQTPDTTALEVEQQYPSSAQMNGFFDHLETTLNEIGFIVKAHPGQIMSKLRRLYNRARPEEIELNILRGILTATLRSTKTKESKD
jgi:tRNA (cytidine32/uridine32-2'-O)-methyltransferase